MAGPAPEFKPLLDAGAVPLSDSSELRFYVDEFKGHKFASIRTFLKGGSYTGPTKAGVTFNGEILDSIVAALEKLPKDPAGLGEQELGRYPKRPGVELVARITIFKDATGVDIREWVEDVSYKGWSKKGVRIPYKDAIQAAGFLKEMRKALAK